MQPGGLDDPLVACGAVDLIQITHTIWTRGGRRQLLETPSFL